MGAMDVAIHLMIPIVLPSTAPIVLPSVARKRVGAKRRRAGERTERSGVDDEIEQKKGAWALAQAPFVFTYLGIELTKQGQ
jgi:hypothetical protein